jgi:hypothetical protein
MQWSVRLVTAIRELSCRPGLESEKVVDEFSILNSRTSPEHEMGGLITDAEREARLRGSLE